MLFDLAEFRLAQKSNVCSKIAASLLLAVHAGRSSASHSVDNAFALALQSDGLFVSHAAPVNCHDDGCIASQAFTDQRGAVTDVRAITPTPN